MFARAYEVPSRWSVVRGLTVLVAGAILPLLAAPGWTGPAASGGEVLRSAHESPEPMPPHPNVLAQIAAEGYDSVTLVDLSRLARLKRDKGVDQSEPVRAPVTGTRPALVLLVEFSDLTHAEPSTPALYQSLLFSRSTYPAPGSLRDFYQEASYGAFDISPGYVDSAWRQTANPHTYYADADGLADTADDYGYGSYPNNAQGLVVDAVTLADPYVDFSSYATGGEVQGLFVVHAGRGADTDTSHRDWIWSHKWSLNENVQTVDGVVVNRYTMEPEYVYLPGDSTVGVFCHEYGHLLGLPDLYDTDQSSEGLGNWSLMAGGSWNGVNGRSPAQLDAWCKLQLGWVTPAVPTAPIVGARLPAAEGTPAAYQFFPWGVVGGSEYFLIENRQGTSFDAALPASGLLLYHVDEAANQTDDWHPKVMVEQADGYFSLQLGANRGDAGDPYPGTSGNRTVSAATTPSTSLYTGDLSMLEIRNISDSAATMTFDFGVQALAVIYDFPLNTDPGWAREGEWAFGQPQGGDDPPGGHTGTSVYGYNLYGDYPDDMAAAQYLTTGPLDCSAQGAVALSFWRWLGVESSDWDHAVVEVSVDGTTWAPVWANPDFTLFDESWALCYYDISALAAHQPAVRVRWGMGPTDTSVTYGGWNLDDVQILGDTPVGMPPAIDFSATPTRGKGSLPVSFTDLSTNSPTSWAWDFGDGATSTARNPSHTYAAPGSYTVALTATNGVGPATGSIPRCVMVSFMDVPISPVDSADFWALRQILACVEAGIVNGYDDGTYRSGLVVTRDQMAVFVSRALSGGDENVPAGPAAASFPDVPNDHWAFRYVEYAVDQGVVAGYDDGTYRPTDPVDRGQMAVYVARALVAPRGEAGLADYVPVYPRDFPDVPADFWAYRHVEYCAEFGVVGGYDDGTYRPSVQVTRDQIAVYVQRAFGLPI